MTSRREESQKSTAISIQELKRAIFATNCNEFTRRN